VWGIYSNRSLATDPTPYPDDVIVHGADYGALGQVEAPHLYVEDGRVFVVDIYLGT
jgi:hypothetical protein